MPQIILDAMDSATAWSAFAPDRVTASTQIAIADDAKRFRFGIDKKSGRIQASALSLHHSLRRNLPNLDLTSVDELRIWLFGDRAAAVSPAQAFYLELRLASAAVPLGDASNTWQRFLPVTRASAWEQVRISLAGLPDAIRSAVDRLELRVVDASSAFTLNVDDVIAVREELVGDVEATLVAELNGQLVLDNAPVPALVHAPGAAPSLPSRFIRIALVDVRYSDVRTSSVRPRGEFSTDGYNLRPSSVAYDLYYHIDVAAEVRSAQTRMMDFVLRQMPPQGTLIVNGTQVPVESATWPAAELPGGVRTDRAPLLFKISVRQQLGAAEPVHGVEQVTLEAELAS